MQTPESTSRPWIEKACAGFTDFQTAVEGRRPSRTPVILFAVNPYCATVGGARYSDCMLDPDTYVECIVKLAERFPTAALMNVGCGIPKSMLERSDVVECDGVRFLRDRRSGELVMRVPDDGNPQGLRNGQLPAQSSNPDPPDPDAVRVPPAAELAAAEPLDVVKEVLRRIGDRVLVSRGICNASNTVVAWLGLEQTCLLMRRDPDYVKALADRGTAVACQQVRAQASLGLRLYYTGGSWGSLFGPRDYEEFFADSQVEVNRTIHECGGLALLHLTGRQSHIVDANLASKPDIVLADQDDLAGVVRAYGGRACVAGAVEPSKLLLPGPADRIQEEVGEQIELAGAIGFIVCTTDCVVKDTPADHVDAMLRAAEEATGA